MTLPYMIIFLFFLATLSASIVPAQAEIVLFAVLATGKYIAWPLLATVCAGTFAGTAFNWALGRYLITLQHKKWFPIKSEYIQKAQELFQKHGRITLLLAGVPFIGDPITIVAGAAHINFGFYITVAGLSKCVRFALVWLLYKGLV